MTTQIDRSIIADGYLNGFTGKLFSLTLRVGNDANSRTAGVNAYGQPTWLFKSAKQAHQTERNRREERRVCPTRTVKPGHRRGVRSGSLQLVRDCLAQP